MNHIRVVEEYKTKEKINPISGHSWTENYGKPWFEVRGPLGLIQTCKTLEKAESVAAEWEAFYKKFYATFPLTSRQKFTS